LTSERAIHETSDADPHPGQSSCSKQAIWQSHEICKQGRRRGRGRGRECICDRKRMRRVRTTGDEAREGRSSSGQHLLWPHHLQKHTLQARHNLLDVASGDHQDHAGSDRPPLQEQPTIQMKTTAINFLKYIPAPRCEPPYQ